MLEELIMNPSIKEGAVLALFSRENPGLVLTIERTVNGILTYSFPGGKRENNESIVTTAVRETYEETGILVKEEDVSVVYSGICTSVGETPYWVTGLAGFVDSLHGPFTPLEPDMVCRVMSIEEFERDNAFPGFNWHFISNLRALKYI